MSEDRLGPIARHMLNLVNDARNKRLARSADAAALAEVRKFHTAEYQDRRAAQAQVKRLREGIEALADDAATRAGIEFQPSVEAQVWAEVESKARCVLDGEL